MSRIPPGDPRLDAHQQWGAAGVWLLFASAGLRASWRRRLDGARGWIALAAAHAAAAVVTGIALSGAAISHHRNRKRRLRSAAFPPRAIPAS